VRRSFSAFGPGERRDLAGKAAQGARVAEPSAAGATWNVERAVLPLPRLRQLMGIA
jgi:hypothetical protein